MRTVRSVCVCVYMLSFNVAWIILKMIQSFSFFAAQSYREEKHPFKRTKIFDFDFRRMWVDETSEFYVKSKCFNYENILRFMKLLGYENIEVS